MGGDLSNALPKGFSIRSSQVPQSGKLDADLGFPTDEGVTVYQFGAAGYSISAYDADFEEWDTADGAGPVVGVAEGFWVLRESATNWTRSLLEPKGGIPETICETSTRNLYWTFEQQ